MSRELLRHAPDGSQTATAVSASVSRPSRRPRPSQPAATHRLLLATAVLVASATRLAAQDDEAAPAPSAEPPPAASSRPSEPRPWRLDDLVAPQQWLRVSGETRIRYEGINGQFRSANRLDYSDHVVVQRTSLRLDADFDPVRFTIEGLDSRVYGADSGSQVNDTVVNPLDVLQAHGEVDLGELAGGEHVLRFGRETLDLGSRRLVARNRFRNTINSFTGLDWQWSDEQDASFRAFYLLPVQREPDELDRLTENDPELDNEDFDLQFFGFFYERPVAENVQLELYAFGLLEEGANTNHRELATPGFRLVRAPKRAEWDFEVEMAWQVGTSRTGGVRSDHNASFQHVSAGYTFDADWRPRVRVALDRATGDQRPGDGENQRFDTLFGARRWEYGPTGIYGAIARSNLLSPELRFQVKPAKGLDVFVAWRGIWLDSSTDQWTTARVTDATGSSGNHVGQQIEARVRYDLLPKSVRVEAGIAHLFQGRFQQQAGQDTDTTYGYTQFVWTF